MSKHIYEKFEPLQDRILVQPDEALTKTAGGIIIPQSQEETPNQGIIIAVSKDCKKREVGEKVLYGQYSGFEVAAGGKKLRLMREDDAYAILHE